MDQTVIERVKAFSDLVRKSFSVKQILLFGSYARGTALPDSDIDVAVIVDSIQGDFLDKSADLFELVWKTDCRIEPLLMIEGSDRSGFISEIQKTGYVIYDSGKTR